MPTLSADGNTDAIEGMGGVVRVHGSGTFGGGTLTFQFLGSDGSYHDIDGASFTQAFDKVFELPRKSTIRASLSGATGPSLYYEIGA